ncbi:hypothetical protein BOX15_Mlig004846g3 [Macrostomum lignano]|uniref:Uncharacterized protein n=1 Tax=Macrostomum lignano TaxID=282301 RepID=A0A267DQ04_9PLAT|nr:hypothetical protein BOX15_Mlig004846g3 [Macrostomum lignano]
MSKLHAYFTIADTKRLQYEVLFLIVFHFGFRGREWIGSFKEDAIEATAMDMLNISI